MSKILAFSHEARTMVGQGVNNLSKAVKVTLGPRGRNVLIEMKDKPPHITKDGVTVAKNISFKDKFQNIGAQMVKSVASRTADVAGDGTTTATILAESIFTHGMRLMTAGHDPMSLKRGIDKAVIKAVQALAEQARTVNTIDDIRKVATISANGDDEIGKMIAEAMDKVGNDGIITLEEGKSFESVLTVSNGFEFDRGFVSAYFMTPEEVEAGRNRAVQENALVWLVDGKLNSLVQLQEMIPTLESCAKQGLPVLLIAESIEDVVLHTLAHNAASGKLQCVAVKSPGFGASRREMLQDLAVLTGATLRDPSLVESVTKEVDLAELGRVKRVEVSKDKTVIIGVDGREAEIKAHCDKIRAQLSAANDTWERTQHEKRLAKLIGGVATIEVGASTEVAMKEKRDRIEDALAATRAAVNEGIVPGGGVALLRCLTALKGFSANNKEEDFGVDIIRDAVKEPLRQICVNAGESPEVITNRILRTSGSYGFDAAKLETCDMFERGIVDPTKVVRVALQNAADVAALLLTTECAITFDDEPEQPAKKQ